MSNPNPGTPAVHLDGTIVVGTAILAISGTNYIANNLTFSFETDEVTSLNQQGLPIKQALFDKAFTGDATLQLPSNASPIPTRGSTFTVYMPDGTTSLNCKITGTGIKEEQKGETLLPVKIAQQLN